MPRYMISCMADRRTESGAPPSEAELERLTAFHQEMNEAGILIGGDGLRPSSEGVRIYQEGTDRRVVDGPFSETKELIAGFILIEVGSREEALDWIRRWPQEDVVLEVRQLFEVEEFGEAATPEVLEQQDQLEARIEAEHGK